MKFVITIPYALNAMIVLTENYERDVSLLGEVFISSDIPSSPTVLRNKLLHFLQTHHIFLKVLIGEKARSLFNRRDVIFTYAEGDKQFSGSDAAEITNYLIGALAKLQHGGPQLSSDVAVILLNTTPFAIVTFTKEQEERISQDYQSWNGKLTRWLSDARAMTFGLDPDIMEFRHLMAQAFFGPVRPIKTDLVPVGVRGYYVIYSEKIEAGLKRQIEQGRLSPDKVVANAVRIMTEGHKDREKQLTKSISP